jgi:hypothetical protein
VHIGPYRFPFVSGSKYKEVGFDLVPMEHETRYQCKKEDKRNEASQGITKGTSDIDSDLVEWGKEMEAIEKLPHRVAVTII